MLLVRNIMIKFSIVAVFIIILPLIVIFARIYYLVSTMPTAITISDITEKAQYLIFLIGISFTIAIVIFLVIMVYILKKKLTPINKTLKFARQLASGDFTGNLKVNCKGELGELTRTIKHMKDRLQYSTVKLKNSYDREKLYRHNAETANEQKTEFLKKVSYELHSPLTPVISYSNIIIAKINEGQYDKSLERKIRSIRAHADNMFNIISNLNELSRLEAGEIGLNKSIFDSVAFVEELVNLHQYSANNKNLVLNYIYSENFPEAFFTDREILFHILSNILAYSIHFSPKNAEISIKTKTNINTIEFIITDNIVGLQQETIAHIFENSSDRISNMTLHLSNAKMFGLVSALTNAELLGGILTCECKKGLGSVFKFRLDKNSLIPTEDDVVRTTVIHSASNWEI